MAIDGLTLRAVTAELQTLVGGKLDKIQQPEKDTLLLTVRIERQNVKLLINMHAEMGRLQLTREAFDNPVNAPAFCMLLRRHLIGGRIVSITQSGTDRVCTMQIAARNELMDDVQLRLVLELTGKHGNVILVGGDGRIIDSLRRISPSETSTRVVLAGFTYTPAPAQNKIDVLLADAAALSSAYAAANPVRALTDTFEGLSKVTATALLADCPTPDRLLSVLSRFSGGFFSPCVVYDELDAPLAALPFVPHGYGMRAAPMVTMSLALDAFYAERDGIVRMRRHGASLRRSVENALGRAENKRSSFQDAIESADRLETLRVSGELILANLHLIRPGADTLSAVNYYAEPPVACAVALDPALSPQDNAKRYFKLYRKGKLAREYALSQLAAVAEEIAYLEGQLENLSHCDTQSELAEVREELIAERYIKPDRKAPRKQQFSVASKPLRFCSSDGIDIYVGKNNRQNDQLTMRFARGENLWLHAKDMPGSHVIVLSDGMPPEQTLLEAATIAACYSSGKAAPSVPVDYTLRKNVKKPSGARPGMVIFSTNSTLVVAPNMQLAKSLQVSP